MKFIVFASCRIIMIEDDDEIVMKITSTTINHIHCYVLPKCTIVLSVFTMFTQYVSLQCFHLGFHLIVIHYFVTYLIMYLIISLIIHHKIIAECEYNNNNNNNDNNNDSQIQTHEPSICTFVSPTHIVFYHIYLNVILCGYFGTIA